MNGIEEHYYNELLELCGGNYVELHKMLVSFIEQCKRDIEHEEEQNEEI